MELFGNVVRRAYIRQATPSPSRRASTTPRTAAAAGGALHVHSTVCAAITDPQTTYRSVVVALLCGGLYLLADTIARYYSHYSGYGFTRLSVHRRRCGRGSVCSGVCQRTPRHSSRTVLRSQRHYHHHYKPIGSHLMAPKNNCKGSTSIRKGWQVKAESTPCDASRDVGTARFRRRRVVVGGPLQQWQADLTEFEKQRRYDLSPHGDRRLQESGLVCSAEKQVRDVVGDSAEKYVLQILAKYVAVRSMTCISE